MYITPERLYMSKNWTCSLDMSRACTHWAVFQDVISQLFTLTAKAFHFDAELLELGV